jgi:hypothetical protein
LYSFAIDPNISVERAGAIALENIYDLFTLPLSTIAKEELNILSTNETEGQQLLDLSKKKKSKYS